MSLQTILNESNSLIRRQMDETKGLVSKWNKTGLLDGLSNEYEQHGMAIMLENQAKQLVTEANSTGIASNSEQWSGVALPLVRRVFAEIAAKDFVSVQPMNLPSGLVFYMDFKYGTAQPGFQTSVLNSSTTPSSGDYQNNSVFGITTTSGDASEGLYGSGRFGYSINDSIKSNNASGSFSPSATQVAISNALDGDTDEDEFNYDSKFIAAYSALAPYMASELLELLFKNKLKDVAWPVYDAVLAVETQVTMAVQVNGKLRATIHVPVDALQEYVEPLALKEVAKWLEGQQVVKIIFVSNRLINIVIKGNKIVE